MNGRDAKLIPSAVAKRVCTFYTPVLLYNSTPPVRCRGASGVYVRTYGPAGELQQQRGQDDEETAPWESHQERPSARRRPAARGPRRRGGRRHVGPCRAGDFVSAGTFVRTPAGSSSKKDFYFGITVLLLQWTTNVIPTIVLQLMHDLANGIEFAKDIYF